MIKLNLKETMLAQSYAAYIMAASCFRSSVCRTPQMEKRAYLVYRLAGERKQLEMEERILSLLDKKVLPHMDAEFLSSKVEVRFLPRGNGICISDGFKVLEISQNPYRNKDRKPCIGISVSSYPASSY